MPSVSATPTSSSTRLHASPRRRDRFSRGCDEAGPQVAVEAIHVGRVQTRHHASRSAVGVGRAKSQLRPLQSSGSRDLASERGVDGDDIGGNKYEASVFVLEDEGAD